MVKINWLFRRVVSGVFLADRLSRICHENKGLIVTLDIMHKPPNPKPYYHSMMMIT